MVTAFDNSGDVIDQSLTKPCNMLIGFLGSNNQVSMHWRLLKNEELPDTALDQVYVDNLFAKVKYTTYEKYDTDRQMRRHKIKIGWYTFLGWAVLIPVLIGTLEYFSDFLSLLALIFIVYKAIRKTLELIGKWPKSKKVKDKEEENR